MPGILLTLFLALCLKQFFSQAGPAELDWILRPVASGVAMLTGTHFAPDDRLGFVSQNGATIIAPACSGINFMIAALLTMALSGLTRFKSHWAATFWPLACLALAYVYTIAVNTLRIVAAMSLYNSAIHWGWLTEARLHRLLGVVLYFLALWANHRSISMLPEQRQPTGKINNGPLLPLACYLGVALLIPLLRNPGIFSSPLFREHFGFVLGGCGLVFGMVFLVQSFRRSEKNAGSA